MGFLWFLLCVGPLIFVHELGHFLVAKACGVKVLKFSLGFGPRLVGFTRGDTEYVVSALPLGGYVRMAGEVPGEEIPPEEQATSFTHQAPWKRALISAAGPFASLAFPVLVYFFVFVGTHQEISNRVGTVEAGLPAAEAGLEPGDRILAVDGEPVRTFRELQTALEPTHGRQVALQVERDDQVLIKRLVPRTVTETNPIETRTRGVVGISPYRRPVVVGVPADSAAHEAGLRTFDRIVGIGNAEVAELADLRGALARAGAGPLTVKVERLAEGESWPSPEALMAGTEPKLSVHTLEVPRQEGEGLSALGVESAETWVAEVVPDSPAAQAGIEAGDRLGTFNGTKLASAAQLGILLEAQGDKPFQLTFAKQGSDTWTEVTIAQAEVVRRNSLGAEQKVLDLGVRRRAVPPASVEKPEEITVKVGPLESLSKSFLIVPEITGAMVKGIGALFTMEDGHKQVGSVLLIADLASQSAAQGLDAFLGMMAMISINLGVINLLPIPILDGFALLSALWEQIRRRPIPARAREVANMVGLAMLVMLMGLALFNDFQRKRAQYADAQERSVLEGATDR